MAIIRRNDKEQGLSRARSWDPFEMMDDMLRWDPFQLLGRSGYAEGLTFTPSFEVKETNDSYLFKCDLPGVKEDDLDISLTGNRLTVSGKREDEKRDEGDQYYCYERSFGSFSRSFSLPDGVDADHVRADLKSGVLTIAVPKKPEVQPKRISLKPGATEQQKAKA